MHEKQQQNCISMILSAIFVIPDPHFGVYFLILDRFYGKMGINDTPLHRDFSGFILSQTNVSSKITKFGTKLSDGPLSQKYMQLFDNHFTHRLQNLKCKGRLPPPQNTNFWPLHKRWHMAGNISFSTAAPLQLNIKWTQNPWNKSISDM